MNLCCKSTHKDFKSSCLPYLVELFVFIDDSFQVVLDSPSRLDNLFINSISFDNLSVSPDLPVSSLNLSSVNDSCLGVLLTKCPYLRFLELSNCSIDVIQHRLQALTLNYLASLRISDCSNLFPSLPRLPRLRSLVAVSIPDFSLKNFNTKFPQLKNCILFNCPLAGTLSQANYSVESFTIQYMRPNCPLSCFTFLSHFYNLERLSLQISFLELDNDQLILPPNIKHLFCTARFDLVKSSLESLTKLCSISGTLYVKKFQSEDARNWLSDFHRLRPLVSSRLGFEFCS
ncbi:hypothetical protein RCL1_008159 [Eukaryota sp. TZLM3-RCL]